MFFTWYLGAKEILFDAPCLWVRSSILLIEILFANKNYLSIVKCLISNQALVKNERKKMPNLTFNIHFSLKNLSLVGIKYSVGEIILSPSSWPMLIYNNI